MMGIIRSFDQLFQLEKDGKTRGVTAEGMKRVARFPGSHSVVFYMRAETPETPTGHVWPQKPKYVTIYVDSQNNKYIQAMYYGRKSLLYKVG